VCLPIILLFYNHKFYFVSHERHETQNTAKPRRNPFFLRVLRTTILKNHRRQRRFFNTMITTDTEGTENRMIILFNLRELRVLVNKQGRVALPVWVAARQFQALHGERLTPMDATKRVTPPAGASMPFGCGVTALGCYCLCQGWRQVNEGAVDVFTCKSGRAVYSGAGCARWGASGALFPKSAYAGLNPLSRVPGGFCLPF